MAAVCPPGAGRKLGKEKKTFRSYWEDRDLCLAALERKIKGNLSVSRYSRSDVGTLFAECLSEDSSRGDLSQCIQEEHLTVHNCSSCLNKLPLSPGGG